MEPITGTIRTDDWKQVVAFVEQYRHCAYCKVLYLHGERNVTRYSLVRVCLYLQGDRRAQCDALLSGPYVMRQQLLDRVPPLRGLRRFALYRAAPASCRRRVRLRRYTSAAETHPRKPSKRTPWRGDLLRCRL